MRRSFLSFTVLSLAAWSQPAPQQAQPLIVVKVEMPPEGIWTSLFKLVIPTILGAGLGAGITLYGVSKTNKHNATENAADRENQLQVEAAKANIAAEAKSRDNRWAFRKDVYVNLINATTDLIRFYANLRLTNAKTAVVERNAPDAARRFHEEQERVEHWKQFRMVTDTLMKHLHLAKLATADEVFPALEKTTKDLFSATDPYSLSPEALTDRIMTYFDLRTRLCDAGRKDLWGAPNSEAKADAALQW
jgi:hypothetical protein